MGSTVPLNLINILHEFEALVPFAIPVALGTLSLLFLYFIKGLIFTYGPIYSIRTGASTLVVLNSTDVAEEVSFISSLIIFIYICHMVTRHSSISLRKLSTELKILTLDNALVAASDYNDFHKMGRRHKCSWNQCSGLHIISLFLLSLNKRHRSHRDTLRENVASQLYAHVRVYVEELGTTLSRDEIFKILVAVVLEGVLEVDWRDWFPYLRRWVPNNKSLEMKIQDIYFRRKAVMNSLIKERTNRIASGEEVNSFLDYLLCEAKTLTMGHITTFGLLYVEIKNVCGSDKITEEHLSQLPYLNAVFHETLRKHSPASVALFRYAHEDTHINSSILVQIALNIYGCNRDKNEWESPEEWKPERFLWTRRTRACAGSLQAMLIACTTIGMLVQEFEWRPPRGGEEENDDTATFTTHKLHPLHLHAILKPRNHYSLVS
ncbi:hypothetical protein ACE6H2_003943 [Prunus campanulata]